jgi:hypothetical protein
MYKIRRCPVCGAELHIHTKAGAYQIRNHCECISELETKEFDLKGSQNDFAWKNFSDVELERFLCVVEIRNDCIPKVFFTKEEEIKVIKSYLIDEKVLPVDQIMVMGYDDLKKTMNEVVF